MKVKFYVRYDAKNCQSFSSSEFIIPCRIIKEAYKKLVERINQYKLLNYVSTIQILSKGD